MSHCTVNFGAKLFTKSLPAKGLGQFGRICAWLLPIKDDFASHIDGISCVMRIISLKTCFAGTSRGVRGYFKGISQVLQGVFKGASQVVQISLICCLSTICVKKVCFFVFLEGFTPAPLIAGISDLQFTIADKKTIFKFSNHQIFKFIEASKKPFQ
ncbi:MAG: hypothetical protein SFW35_03630 [Chitinophagales bacterium]|nr:hypothetical protein [Chitinophagales bacterium]